jgi:hypothetical protein
VNPFEHQYIEDIEHREEGGTPGIIESIRAGMVFQLKESVGWETIRRREGDFVRSAIDRWQQNEGLLILGNPDAWRLSIVSFVVKHEDRFLHHNFTVSLLNDLFGIQARGGCSCAGPYGHRLLGIDLVRSKEFEREIVRGCEGIKPGWVRVNFNYFISDAVTDFVIKAIEFVAREGWKLLPHYIFEPETGQWRHRMGRPEPAMRLKDLTYRSGKLEYRSRQATEPEWILDTYLSDAQRIVDEAVRGYAGLALTKPELSDDFEHLRWFTLPSEALSELQKD